MKRKLLAVMMMSSMLVANLAGCGSASDASDESKVTTESATETTEKVATEESSDEDKVITFWCQATSDADKAIYEESFELFNAMNTGYTIEMTSYNSDVYKEKILIAMSSGECPDMYTSWSGGPMYEYIDSGFAQPVTELFAATENYDKVLKAALEQGTYKGELYGVPITDISLSGLFYNKTMFDELGLEEPTTVSELETVCDTLVANGITPFNLANASSWPGSMYFVNLATRYGGLEPFADAVTGEGSFEAENFVYAGEKIREWVEKGYFPEGVNSMDENLGQARQMLYQETAAMYMMGSWAAATIKNESEEFYENISWFPFPAVDGKEENANIAVGTVGNQFISFNCTGEKLDTCIDYAALFSTQEMVDFLVSQGKLPPIEGAGEGTVDDVVGKVLEFSNSAEKVQLWYDQYLPPSVAAVHLETSQAMYGLTMTAEEAAAKFEAAMVESRAE